jgi:hypothetical protein
MFQIVKQVALGQMIQQGDLFIRQENVSFHVWIYKSPCGNQGESLGFRSQFTLVAAIIADHGFVTGADRAAFPDIKAIIFDLHALAVDIGSVQVEAFLAAGGAWNQTVS